MKRTFITIALGALILVAAGAAQGQGEGRATFTGTAVIYGTGVNTRTVTRTFKLDITGVTPASDADRMVNLLQDDGQDRLLREIDGKDLGRFSLGADVGQRVNAVLVDQVDGRQQIRVIFARWIGFGELRYGRRSDDYPFSYVELLVDPRTGKGEGSYFQAARIRARGRDTVEIEDFGTWPSRLMGVTRRGSQLN